MALVLDTGVILAMLDANDQDHARCAQLVSDAREELIVPAPVLVELDHLLESRRQSSVWLAFAERVATGGYSIYQTDAELLVDSARLQSQYADLRLGFVDACVFVICARMEERKVATLDRRHFSVLRTEDGGVLHLLPESA